MKVFEIFCEGKHSPATCEDGWTVTPDFAVVADGSTSKAAKAHPGEMSSGQRAMRTILHAVNDLPAKSSMQESLVHFTKALRQAVPNIGKLPAVMRPTCSAVIFSRHRREVWMIGDCQCRFAGHTHTHPKLVDDILTRIRCEILDYLLTHGHSEEELRRHDMGRSFILDALRDQTNFQNDANLHNPFRYPVFDGGDIRPEDVPVLSLPIGTDRLILASDGYPVLSDTLEETERKLTTLLRSDPLCCRENPATKGLMEGNKSFDDRTFLSLEI